MTPGRQIGLLIHGARGRMGTRIEALARDDARFNVVAAVDSGDRAIIDALTPNSVQVIIDFSSDEGAQAAVSLAMKQKAALLVGTTGLSAKNLDSIEVSARSIPVMTAPNTSLGVAVLSHLVAVAARLLGPEFDIDLIEAHHSLKRDAPSGTALRLADALHQETGAKLEPQRMHCIRAGDIIGEHIVQFSGPGEILKIFHSATNRDLFARGALRTAAWLHDRPPGRYTVEQSLGL